jgi:lysozyme family protein
VSRSVFDRAVELVLWIEDRSGRGVVTETAGDRGGLTKWGISSRAYPGLDIRNLSRAGAIELYRRDYWDRIRGDELPPALAISAFDAAVNQGVAAAVKDMQRAVRVKVDGELGPVTLAALRRANTTELLRRFGAKRIKRYAATSAEQLESFGDGWFMRLLEVHEDAALEALSD